MKKYVKPDLYFESFALSHSVASGCGFAPNHAPETCILGSDDYPNLEPGEFFFQNDHCNIDPVEAGFEDICYQTGTDNGNIFTS